MVARSRRRQGLGDEGGNSSSDDDSGCDIASLIDEWESCESEDSSARVRGSQKKDATSCLGVEMHDQEGSRSRMRVLISRSR